MIKLQGISLSQVWHWCINAIENWWGWVYTNIIIYEIPVWFIFAFIISWKIVQAIYQKNTIIQPVEKTEIEIFSELPVDHQKIFNMIAEFQNKGQQPTFAEIFARIQNQGIAKLELEQISDDLINKKLISLKREIMVPPQFYLTILGRDIAVALIKNYKETKNIDE